ncbi:5-formyltetrahydrofolate cyclo-ligase [Deinococcus radiophilus]|uniref:5-formyltetrahydrofolate cyclo-ligase n=1 Tax=Deinococcus radiophilus TaxID=32062 RepID=A0A3S0KCM8_9DEIO|nr:5-formyltetrahydrofolate cyclo-ligase [Deinococcus radiophilus]RTR27784.1 5-formyltetrahydrofolate cyclo-ligase [Deinococcus radiophilus]UFA50106.1 5-formyltetrahydrofolate cyclo-ligase [Deinococcus radiophilus]
MSHDLPPVLSDPKPMWRSWALKLRAEQPDRSGAVAQHVTSLLRELGAGTVLTYHALNGEPDLRSLGSEFRLLTTRARVRPERRLTLHEWNTATERSPVGVMQPPRDTPQINSSEVDAVVLPGIAFDRRGIRLGYGGGFYDRFLEGYTGPKIGVTFAALLLDEVPREPHDVPLDWIVTEAETLRVPPLDR